MALEHAPAPDTLPPPPPIPQELLNRRPPPPPANLPDPSELIGQLKQLDELLSLPADRLLRLRQTIELIEKMSPAERETMRIRLAQVTRTTPELRSEIDAFTAMLPTLPRTDISQFWLAASPEERDSVRLNIEKMEPAAAAEFLLRAIQQFVRKRDDAFQKMQAELEAKKVPTRP